MIRNAGKYQSQFGGLWTDMANAHEEIKARLDKGLINDEQAEMLTFWVDKGYVIIPNAVPHDVIDQITDFIEKAWETLDRRLKVEGIVTSSALDLATRYNPGQKIVDIYVLCLAALKAMFADKIVDFLKLIFEQDILAFQTLSFERGTQQPMHQDPAYVVLSSPMKMAASWIALEDIESGSGELVYYEGSHKIEEFLFEGIYKNWNQRSSEIHYEYLESLHTKSQAMNLPLRKFQPKKGDVLIWAADLVHGGSEITHSNPKVTRRSLVTHYCPYDVNPGYFRNLPPQHRVKIKFRNDCYYSSGHYLLSADSSELKTSSAEVYQLRDQVKLLQSRIQAMESSKFWQLRKGWFRLKRSLGLKVNE